MYFYCCFCIWMLHIMSYTLEYPSHMCQKRFFWLGGAACRKLEKFPCHLPPVALSIVSTGASALWFPKLLFQRYSSGGMFIPFSASGEKPLTAGLLWKRSTGIKLLITAVAPDYLHCSLDPSLYQVWQAVTPGCWAQSKELYFSDAEATLEWQGCETCWSWPICLAVREAKSHERWFTPAPGRVVTSDLWFLWRQPIVPHHFWHFFKVQCCCSSPINQLQSHHCDHWN